MNAVQLTSPSQSRRRSLTNGASTPKDLTARLKILELFTLHVLPRNEEWDYARAFINGSDILDEERRELFLQTLQEIQDVQADEAKAEELEQLREDELQRQRDLESERVANGADRRNLEVKPSGAHRRTGSEVDYGIETGGNSSDATNGKPLSNKPVVSSKQTSKPAATRRSRPSQKPPSRQTKALLDQARKLLYALWNSLANTIGSLSGNSATIVKTLVFLVSVMMLFGRQEVRDRTKRMLNSGWEKLVQTGKMGGKVSYI